MSAEKFGENRAMLTQHMVNFKGVKLAEVEKWYKQILEEYHEAVRAKKSGGMWAKRAISANTQSTEGNACYL